MTKYNVFVVTPSNLESTIDRLNEISLNNPDFNPLLKPHQYMHKLHKDYLRPLLNNEYSMFEFKKVLKDLSQLDSSLKVSNQVLSAYLKENGFAPTKVKANKFGSLITLWKHQNNKLC